MAMSMNILDPSPKSLLSPSQPLPSKPEERRGIGDIEAARRNIYSRVHEAVQGLEPVSNATHTLSLRDIHYQDPDTISLKDQKAAVLGGHTRGRRLRGTWDLHDNVSGKVLDSKKAVLMTVPHLTQRGTYIHRGTEYTLRNQQRLRPGVFTRVRDNGEIEAHANIMPGKGLSHRYYLNPETGVFYLRAGQAKIPLMPLVKTMGATPKQLQDAWGGIYLRGKLSARRSVLTHETTREVFERARFGRS